MVKFTNNRYLTLLGVCWTKNNTFLFKSLTSVVLFITLLFSNSVSGQTSFNCPNADRCTSKDLEVVGATLVTTSCSCTPGQTTPITGTLTMTIINKTGSVRTSFAFFATLERRVGNTVVSTELISRCGGPVPANDTKTLTFGNISYTCGQNLRLTNVFLAWTDASDGVKNDCTTILANNCAKISPKCGTDDEIIINTPLTFSSSTAASCEAESDGSITVSPTGGTAPYSVTIAGTTFANIPSGGSATKTGLAGGPGISYSVSVSDAATPTCTVSSTVNLGDKVCCVTPTIDDQPDPQVKCAEASASFTVVSTGGFPTPTVQWQESTDGGTNFNPISDGGIYDISTATVSGTTTSTLTIDPVSTSMNGYKYRAVLTSGRCAPATSNAALLTVNLIPTVDQPGNQTVCDDGLTDPINFSGTGTSYTWTNDQPSIGLGSSGTGNISAFTAQNNGTTPVVATITVTPHYLNAGVTCTGTAKTCTITVNPKPSIANQTPAAICSPDGVTLGASDFTGTNIIPAGTTYSWSAPVVVGVTGLGSGTNQSSFSTGTLTNTTNETKTVVYTVTPTAGASVGSCVGASFTITVVVNPKPPIPTVSTVNPTCSTATGSITVLSPVNSNGSDYRYDFNGAGYVTSTGPFIFKAGEGYTLNVKDFATGCVSSNRTCPVDPNLPATNKVSEPTEEVAATMDIDAHIGASRTRVLAAPNPFTDKVRFTLQSDVSGQGSLEIYNTMGQKIATVYQGYIEAGKTLNKEYVVQRAYRANLIYVFRVGDQKTTGKLLNW